MSFTQMGYVKQDFPFRPLQHCANTLTLPQRHNYYRPPRSLSRFLRIVFYWVNFVPIHCSFLLTAMLFRLILLLAIAGGLTVFALSNGSTLALTFLGMQTPTLPLSLWVLGAIAAGIITHVLIASLFRISNLLAVAEARSQMRRNERRRDVAVDRTSRDSAQRPSSSDDADWDWQGDESPADRKPTDRQPSEGKTKIQDPIDDWESDAEDDWDDEPRQSPVPKPEPRPATSYGYPPRQPTTIKPAARSPESSNSVVDADFRVLVPPTRSVPQPTPQPMPRTDDADDWFEDDDLETDEERRRRSER